MSLEPLHGDSVSQICTSRNAHLKRLHLKMKLKKEIKLKNKKLIKKEQLLQQQKTQNNKN